MTYRRSTYETLNIPRLPPRMIGCFCTCGIPWSLALSCRCTGTYSTVAEAVTCSATWRRNRNSSDRSAALNGSSEPEGWKLADHPSERQCSARAAHR
jgi:hypothetical protein